MSDIKIIKQILLKLFDVTDDKIIFNEFWFLDMEMRNLLRELFNSKE